MSASAIRILDPQSSRWLASKEVQARGTPAIRVICVDDHPTIREGIGAIVNRQTDMKMVGVAPNGCEGIRMFRELHPDVTLMDLRLPDMGGIEALTSIRSEFPRARVLIFTTFDGEVDILRSLRSGAAGYLLKSTPSIGLVAAIRHVHQGNRSVAPEVTALLVEHLGDEALSQREIEVLRHLAGGNRNRDIAQALFISEETVKGHVKHIMEKLGANDRTHALAIAVRRGIIQI